MFRDLARTTAALKGKRYEGAVIAAVRWRRGRFECQIGMPEIQKGRHGLCVLRAADESGELMLTLLLGRQAPQAEAGQPPRVLQAVARGQGIRPSACSLRSAKRMCRRSSGMSMIQIPCTRAAARWFPDY